REDARLGATPLERILEDERVEDDREHSRVVGSSAVHAFCGRGHAPPDVPAAGDDGDLQPRRVDLDDLGSDRVDGVRVETELAIAHQRLARELQEDAPEGTSGRRGGARLLLVDRAHPARAKRSNSSTSAPSSSSALPTVFDVSWIQGWSVSTWAAKKRLFS